MSDAVPEVAGEVAQIEAVMAANPAEYWSSDMPDRYRSLIEARAAGLPPPPACGGPAVEIRALERLLSEDPRRYWNSPEAQARMRELYAGQEEARSPEQVTEHVALPTLGEALHESPDLDADVFMARRQEASHLLIGLDPGDAAALRDAFDKLGDVGVHALDGIASAGHVFAAPATAEEVADFASDPVGGELVRSWGDEAAARVGAVHERIARVLIRLAEADGDRVLDFVWRLPPAPREAVLRRLAQ